MIAIQLPTDEQKSRGGARDALNNDTKEVMVQEKSSPKAQPQQSPKTAPQATGTPKTPSPKAQEPAKAPLTKEEQEVYLSVQRTVDTANVPECASQRCCV
jgi:hypothetical protein